MKSQVTFGVHYRENMLYCLVEGSWLVCMYVMGGPSDQVGIQVGFGRPGLTKQLHDTPVQSEHPRVLSVDDGDRDVWTEVSCHSG